MPGFRRLTRRGAPDPRLPAACDGIAGSARADEDEGPIIPEPPASASTGSAAGDEAGGIPYKVTFTGIEDDRLETLMKESSQLIALQDRPPTTMAGLIRRIDQDVNRFGEVLRSQGYYQGSINHRIDTEADPIRVKFAIETGPPFLLAAYNIRYVGAVRRRIPRRPSRRRRILG